MTTEEEGVMSQGAPGTSPFSMEKARKGILSGTCRRNQTLPASCLLSTRTDFGLVAPRTVSKYFYVV